MKFYTPLLSWKLDTSGSISNALTMAVLRAQD